MKTSTLGYRLSVVVSAMTFALFGVAASPAPAMADDVFWVFQNVESQKCLDLDARYQDYNGANIQQWGCWNAANQQWYVHRYSYEFGETWYQIISRQSGRCLDVDYNRRDENGANVQQWDCYGGWNQLWAIYPDDTNGWKMWTRHSQSSEYDYNLKCLDLDARYQRYDGANVQQWDCWNGQNQRWWAHRHQTP
jgi:hypothetical protein